MRNPLLRHVYANLAELNDTLFPGGSTTATNAGNNVLKFGILEEVSRLVDTKAHRGSGFGPWVGTEKYDGNGLDTLYLRADLDALTSLSVKPTQTADAVTPVVETDFYLAGIGSYDKPYRKVLFHGQGSPTTVGTGKRTIEATGSWSYPYATRVLTATTTEVLDSSETGVDVSALTEFSPGMTILIDAEQLYVTATSILTLTVERGVNGTTAASHLTAAPITSYVYDPSVHSLTLRLAQRRWKSRDANADGGDGGGDTGITVMTEGEDTMIRRMLGPVRLVGNV